ncbi:hypothetical protein JMM81_20735 [Bacillus sp. V3B]|uniref:hypothetical protein n=1 Tax=Bacillus sp. V3B TaxID=2804915 RepID=UPI002108F61C|nr:hypothetical protein [Bacillus sp. V3B]MCQ6277303.1 hypothetical protein [Bacillus sp. V3B]
MMVKKEIVALLIERAKAGDFNSVNKLFTLLNKDIPEDIKRMSLEEIEAELKAIDEQLKEISGGDSL